MATVVRKEENAFHELRKRLHDASSITQSTIAGTDEVQTGREKDASDTNLEEKKGGEGGNKDPESNAEQAPHREKTETICLVHFNMANSYLRFARDRHMDQEKAAAAASAEEDEEAQAREKEEEEARSRRKQRGELTGAEMERQEEVKRPISTTTAKTLEFQRFFLRTFPFQRFQLSNRQQKKDAMRLAEKTLTSKKICQIIGLLCHLLYWTLFDEYAVATLPNNQRENILLCLQKLQMEIDQSLHKRKHYTLFHLPLFMDSICSTVHNLFHLRYPKWFAGPAGAKTDTQIVNIIDSLFTSNSYLHSSAVGLRSAPSNAPIPPFTETITPAIAEMKPYISYQSSNLSLP